MYVLTQIMIYLLCVRNLIKIRLALFGHRYSRSQTESHSNNLSAYAKRVFMVADAGRFQPVYVEI